MELRKAVGSENRLPRAFAGKPLASIQRIPAVSSAALKECAVNNRFLGDYPA